MTNEANVEKLLTDLKTLSRDAEAILHTTAGQAGEKMGELRERLAAALDSAKATGHRLEQKALSGAKEADSAAVSLAQTARFQPLPGGRAGPGLFPPGGPAWGVLIFRWLTLAPPATNAVPATP